MIATTISSRPLRKVSYSNGKNVMPFSYMTFYNEPFGRYNIRCRKWKDGFTNDIFGLWVKSFDIKDIYSLDERRLLCIRERSKKVRVRLLTLGKSKKQEKYHV